MLKHANIGRSVSFIVLDTVCWLPDQRSIDFLCSDYCRIYSVDSSKKSNAVRTVNEIQIK